MSTTASSAVSPPAGEISRLAEHLFRHESGKLVSVLTGLFGLERLKATLADASGLQPAAAADNVLNTIDDSSGQPPGDDLTMVLVDWTNGEVRTGAEVSGVR